MLSWIAYKDQSVIGISFSLSQSDPIKRRPLYLMELIVAKCNAKLDVDIILKFLENKFVITYFFICMETGGRKIEFQDIENFFFHLIKTIFQEIEVVYKKYKFHRCLIFSNTSIAKNFWSSEIQEIETIFQDIKNLKRL